MKNRVEQVSDFIRSEIAQIIIKEVELPQDSLVTISRVDIANNYRYALIWVSVIPVERSMEIIKILLKNKKPIQKMLAEKLSIIFSPKISFKLDSQVQKVYEVEHLLDQIRDEEDK